jgi:3-oxoacyl-[acyl-carrier protein] reductase
VNNAGIKRDKLVLKMNSDDFSDVLNTNLMSVFYCTKGAISSGMLRQRRGRIINISSVVGQIGNHGQSNYAAAKAGIIGYTKSCAKEFGSRGICVNAVCPGFIKTPMTKDNEEHIDLSRIPLHRLGTAEEVAGLVRYLAVDPSAAYITGHCFNIDGGLGIGAT